MTIQDIILSVGIPTIVFALVYIGRKLEVLDSLQKTIEAIRDRFILVEDRCDILWKDKMAPTNSPRQLNERGTDILTKSGIKEIVDEKKDKLLEFVREKNAQNPYDAERAIEEVMNDLPKIYPELIDQLKNGAFIVGTDIAAVLFVGSIYLRNQIFDDLGFSLSLLDKPRAV